jgi:hypothetical protein
MDPSGEAQPVGQVQTQRRLGLLGVQHSVHGPRGHVRTRGHRSDRFSYIVVTGTDDAAEYGTYVVGNHTRLSTVMVLSDPIQ